MNRWPMVGREREVEQILASLAGGTGTVVVGEPGVGKTMLAREAQRQVEANGEATLLVLGTPSSDFPLQAFGRLLSSSDAPGATELERLHRVLGSHATPPLLVVDDAHLLDLSSADLLYEAAAGGSVRVVATVRANEDAPDSVGRLWKDGNCDRLDLAPLAEADVRTLLETILGGDVEDRLARLLSLRAGGNALLLRELVRSSVDSGALALRHQVWRLVGDLPVGAGVRGLIHEALQALDSTQRSAAELLAVGEPLSLAIAEAAVGSADLESLEVERIATVQDTADGPVVTLAHPLYGEVLTEEMPALRLRRLRSQLTEAIRSATGVSSRDTVRAALWRVELGEALDAHELLAAARAARAFGFAPAQRLARAALEAGGLAAAAILLAELLILDGQVREGDALLGGLGFDELTDAELESVMYLREWSRTLRGDVERRPEVGSVGVDGAPSSEQLRVLRAQGLLLSGNIDAAVQSVRALLGDENGDPVARTHAAFVSATGALWQGRFAGAERIAAELGSVAEETRTLLPLGFGTLLVVSSIAITMAGEFDRAEVSARELYERALAEDDEWLRPRGASALGIVELYRGHIRAATRYFRITVASLNEFDVLFLRFNLSYLARAASLAGRVDEARRALTPPSDVPAFGAFAGDWQLADAAVMAAEGNLNAAAEHALAAAAETADRGQWAVSGQLAHNAARYTGTPEAADAVAAAAAHCGGPIARVFADHARARAERNGHHLSRVSSDFEELGAFLWAAEAAYAAARALRDAGEPRAAALSASRAATLHGCCEGAHLPWVAGSTATSPLTRREHEIAVLAAAGSSDAEISAALHISRRTVQSHLGHVYDKLDIHSRRQLPEALY